MGIPACILVSSNVTELCPENQKTTGRKSTTTIPQQQNHNMVRARSILCLALLAAAQAQSPTDYATTGQVLTEPTEIVSSAGQLTATLTMDQFWYAVRREQPPQAPCLRPDLWLLGR